jgi:hypothetical protein
MLVASYFLLLFLLLRRHFVFLMLRHFFWMFLRCSVRLASVLFTSFATSILFLLTFVLVLLSL